MVAGVKVGGWFDDADALAGAAPWAVAGGNAGVAAAAIWGEGVG